MSKPTVALKITQAELEMLHVGLIVARTLSLSIDEANTVHDLKKRLLAAQRQLNATPFE